MTDAPRPKFQFTIRDLLAVTALACVGLCLLTPFAVRILKPQWERVATPEVQAKCCLLVIGATLCGALAGLWLASRTRRARIARGMLGLAGCVIGWALLVLGLLIWDHVFISHYGGGCSAAGASCKAFVEAEDIYHRTDYDGDGVLEYAQSLRELYETKPGAADLNLVDRSFALAEGPPGVATPKAGYVFKVLKRQGRFAEGGRKSYRPWDPKTKKLSAHMTDGYALVASPGAYDATGRDTFIISNQGTMYQCDLGPQTEKIVGEMEEFDPDPAQGWEPAE
ncbi:MAG: DUF2950 family protein [Planctomycetota bacterium]|nr:DUF2950 family protein [Planctomycetota bacterium]